METVKVSSNTVTRVYLGVGSKEITKAEAVLMIQQNPAMHFEVVLPYPRIEYWLDMEIEKGIAQKRKTD